MNMAVGVVELSDLKSPKCTTSHVNCCQKKAEEYSQPDSKKSFWLQYGIALTASLVYMMDSSQTGWSGPTLLKYKAMGIVLTDEETSWLASSNTLGYAFGTFLGAIGAYFLGRRKTIILAIPPIILGILLTGCVEIIFVKCIGRMVAGLGIASAYTIIPLYIGEISPPHIRGKLTFFLVIGYNFGLLFEFAVGGLTSILVNGLILAAVPMVFVSIFWWMPESPYFLVMKGEELRAKGVLDRLKMTDDRDAELAAIKAFVAKQIAEKPRITDLFGVAANRRALFLTMGIATANVVSGINILLSFAEPILEEANAGFSAYFSTILFGTTGVLTTALSSVFIDSWGRRPLLLLSTSTTSIPLLTLGTYFYLQHIGWEYLSTISLVPVVAVISVKFTMSMGLSTLQYVCQGELFPTNLTSFAACVVESYVSLARFSVTKSYQSCVNLLGMYGVFWGFGSCCILSTIILAVFMPETKNQSLESIQEKLKQKRFK